METSILKNEGVIFIAKFLCLFLLFYYFNLFFISITAYGGRGKPLFVFIKQHLDYIDWLRSSILHTSQAICNLFGVGSHLETDFIIKLDCSNRGLKMVYKCVGYGVMSFWGAFVIANKLSIPKKISWLIIGWVFIWMINCMRVSLLLIALKKNWAISKYLDHHTLFNMVAYGFIFLLIYIYIQYNKVKQ